MSELENKIGALLKLERERLQIDLTELSEELRITEANLINIEKGEVEKLPSKIYFGLFAKSYAEALKIDYTETVKAIKADIEETEESAPVKKDNQNKTKKVNQKAEKKSVDLFSFLKKPTYRKIFYIVAIAILLVGGYFVISQLIKDMQANTSLPAESNQIEQITEEQAGEGTESKYANYDWNVPQYQKPEELKLRLTARSESWATVFADGDTALFRSLIPGRTYDITAKYRMTLSVAVPSAVDIDLNGIRINPVSVETGKISRVDITQINVDSFINPEQFNSAIIDIENNSEPVEIDTTDSEQLQ
ncbi:MAG: RodZ domain-containing protein [bacterium]